MTTHQFNVKLPNSTDEWITPKWLIDLFPPFDLDPCSPEQRPWNTALLHYTNDGLTKPWFGRVWLNPPYSRNLIPLFMKKMADHGNGIALIFGRTDTKFFHNYVFPHCNVIKFIEGRIRFCYPDGSASKDGMGNSVLIGYGKNNIEPVVDSGIRGSDMFPASRMPIVTIGISTTWKAIVKTAIVRAGEEAELPVIYELVEQIAPDKKQKNNFFKEKVRQTLQKHFKRIGKGRYSLN